MITRIPGRVFEMVGQHVYGDIYLYFQSNRIKAIEDTAFAGIGDKVTELNLFNNTLTHIPVAIGTLRALVNLDLTQNPIMSLDALVLTNLSPSLNSFAVSMGNFSAFPTELKLLTNLTVLTLEEVGFPVIDRHAFYGQKQTLEQLEIRNSVLMDLPKAMCDLEKLKTPLIQDNNMTTLNNFSTECSLTSVTGIHLWHNTITAIYDHDISGFINAEFLDLSRNPISYISNDAFKHNINLTTIYLSSTRLHILPVTITTLPNIKGVWLSGLFNCSCATMSGFKAWGQNVLMHDPYLLSGASCDQLYIGVEEYILKQLPNCTANNRGSQ